MDIWFFIMGTVSLLIAIYKFIDTKILIARGISTTGTVIKEKSWGGPGEKLFVNVVRYQTRDKTNVEFKNYSLFSHNVNEMVHILYDPNNPEWAKINSWRILWGSSLVLGLLGILFIVVGLRV